MNTNTNGTPITVNPALATAAATLAERLAAVPPPSETTITEGEYIVSARRSRGRLRLFVSRRDQPASHADLNALLDALGRDRRVAWSRSRYRTESIVHHRAECNLPL